MEAANYESRIGGATIRIPHLQRSLKRTFDVSASAAGLALVLPLLGLAALLVRRQMGLPVLFHHPRLGKDNRPFLMHKFRTMTDDRAGDGSLLPDADRLTRLGRWLRRWSIDELPQLWNVFRGEMSLVGPRPLLPEYLGRYTPEQARRHEVSPGITGWAQVCGRNDTTWAERFAQDVWYVDHWSLFLDLRVLRLTVVKVLNRQGISRTGHATMPLFRGTVRKGDATGAAANG